jgi:hypothetical protein
VWKLQLGYERFVVELFDRSVYSYFEWYALALNSITKFTKTAQLLLVRIGFNIIISNYTYSFIIYLFTVFNLISSVHAS